MGTSVAGKSESDGLLDESMPLPQPPATFSDPSPEEQQLLRVREGNECRESSVIFNEFFKEQLFVKIQRFGDQTWENWNVKLTFSIFYVHLKAL